MSPTKYWLCVFAAAFTLIALAVGGLFLCAHGNVPYGSALLVTFVLGIVYLGLWSKQTYISEYASKPYTNVITRSGNKKNGEGGADS